MIDYPQWKADLTKVLVLMVLLVGIDVLLQEGPYSFIEVATPIIWQAPVVFLILAAYRLWKGRYQKTKTK